RPWYGGLPRRRGPARPSAATLPLSGTAAVRSPRRDLPGERSGALLSHPRRMDNGSLHVRWNTARVPVPLARGKQWTMNTQHRVSIRSVLVVAVCSLVVMLGPPSVWAATHTYSGQATVVRATVLGMTTVVSDTGPLPSSGGALETSLLKAHVDGVLDAEGLHATTIGQGDQSRSEASVANLSLTVSGNTIDADFLMARATAQCQPGGPALSGSSEIAVLVINGQAIAVTGQPN